MKYREAVQRLKQGHEPPALVSLVGEESYFRQDLLRRFSRRWFDAQSRELNVSRMEWQEQDMGDVLEMVSTPPFAGSRRMVIYEAEGLLSAGNKKQKGKRKRAQQALMRYLHSPPAWALLVLVLPAADRRLKATRQLEKTGWWVECETPEAAELEHWIDRRFQQAGYRIEPEALKSMVTAFDPDLRLLDQEIRKITTYAGEQTLIDRETVNRLIRHTAEEVIFDLVDAVAEGRAGDALQRLDRMLKQNEPALRILFMIGRQIRLMWKASLLSRQGLDYAAIKKQMGEHPYVVRKSLTQSRRFDLQAFGPMLDRVLETDIGIKSGRWPERLALERLIVHLCQPATLQQTPGQNALPAGI